MSELRRDTTTGEWVILAPERTARPTDGPSSRTGSPGGPRCPFCPGREADTPDPILVLPEGSGTGGNRWSVRVVPNRFPALRPDAPAIESDLQGPFPRRSGRGFHEVVIESPDHEADLASMPDAQVRIVLEAYRRRARALRAEADVRLVLVFRNRGSTAGTSLSHPHSQIIATPVVPAALRTRHEFATRYFDATGQCVYCESARAEREAGVRLVEESRRFLVHAPFASRTPFETWIVPLRHEPAFSNATDEELDDLAPVLRRTLHRLDRALGRPDYNLIVQTAPIDEERKPYFVWHVQILPRLTTPAGFELGSRMTINGVAPEDAAARLRGALDC